MGTAMDLLWWTNIPGPGWPGAGEKISNFFAQFWKIGLTITEPFLLLRQGMRELQEALEAVGIPDIG